MQSDDVNLIFGCLENEVCQASCKFFHRHPECLTTIERQKLYDYAKKHQIRKIIANRPKMTEEEAKSVLKCVVLCLTKSDQMRLMLTKNLFFWRLK